MLGKAEQRVLAKVAMAKMATGQQANQFASPEPKIRRVGRTSSGD
jgi:hypothetical protein